MKKRNIIIVGVLALVAISIILINFSHSELIDDVEVELNSDLSYYLTVTYDGVDINGVESNDATMTEIRSGNLLIKDKLPEGLTFQNFVTTVDGSIGATKRSDGTECAGFVVDDTEEESNTGEWNDGNTEFYYHGLHYDANTRVVSFQVKALKAGCQLVVGINTKTPATVDDPTTDSIEVRRDFYNFGTISENGYPVLSNTVHAYIGAEDVPMNNVIYRYSGTIPNNAPELPPDLEYARNTTVGVAKTPNIRGYVFSGWTTTDVTVTDEKFTMPNQTVTFTGTWTQLNTNQVSYVIDGPLPEDYIIPSTKNYYPEEVVKVDSLSEGDIVGGYRFLGWTSRTVEIDEDNTFAMPDNNVVITGAFERVTKNVIYETDDDFCTPLFPNNATQSVGIYDEVELTHREANGVRFIGYLVFDEDVEVKDNKFTMPNHDVTVNISCVKVAGEFEPTIKKEIIEPKSKYVNGDIVVFKITVTNTANYDIKDVQLKEMLDNVEYIQHDNYDVASKKIVVIPKIEANSSVEVYAKYKVTEDSEQTIDNIVKLVGALADNDYYLKEDDYEAKVTFKTTVTPKEEKTTETETKTETKSESKVDSPRTLDDILKYVLLFGASVAVIIVLVKVSKNKANKGK